jgi:hypothetical protein
MKLRDMKAGDAIQLHAYIGRQSQDGSVGVMFTWPVLRADGVWDGVPFVAAAAELPDDYECERADPPFETLTTATTEGGES